MHYHISFGLSQGRGIQNLNLRIHPINFIRNMYRNPEDITPAWLNKPQVRINFTDILVKVTI